MPQYARWDMATGELAHRSGYEFRAVLVGKVRMTLGDADFGKSLRR